jgi:acetyl esterase/lipase
MSVYRGMDRATLDAAYDNSAAVADSAAILAGWNARSERLAAARPLHLDLRYGPAERNRVDYFPGAAGAPLLIFIHGGYWQMRAKETFRFLAAGPLAHGMHVAFVGYTLAPAITLAGICDEVRSAIAWIAGRAPGFGADPARICLSGWSAGAHLTAMCLEEPAVRGGLAISGLYDLEPIRLCYVNDKLGLDRESARRLSPLLNLPPRSRPLAIAFGTAELPELQRQSLEFGAARREAGLPGRVVPLAGHNHFTVLEELERPDGALTALAREAAGMQ